MDALRRAPLPPDAVQLPTSFELLGGGGGPGGVVSPRLSPRLVEAGLAAAAGGNNGGGGGGMVEAGALPVQPGELQRSPSLDELLSKVQRIDASQVRWARCGLLLGQRWCAKQCVDVCTASACYSAVAACQPLANRPLTDCPRLIYSLCRSQCWPRLGRARLARCRWRIAPPMATWRSSGSSPQRCGSVRVLAVGPAGLAGCVPAGLCDANCGLQIFSLHAYCACICCC